MGNPIKIIAKNLGEWIHEAKYTQAHVAQKAEVSTNYVNQLLNETNPNPGIQQLGRIAAVFGKSLADLVRDPKDPGGHTLRDCLMVVRRWMLEAVDE